MLRNLIAWLIGGPLFQSIAIARIEPGDVIVYRTDEHLEDRQREACIVHLRREFPGHRVLIVDGGGELQIVSNA